MKLKFYPSGSPDCPILMLTDFQAGEVSALMRSFRSLAEGRQRSVTIKSSGSAGDVSLSMEIAEESIGVLNHAPDFVCRLTAAGWRNAEALLEPFLDETCGGYQWLDESGPVSLLISPTGTW